MYHFGLKRISNKPVRVSNNLSLYSVCSLYQISRGVSSLSTNSLCKYHAMNNIQFSSIFEKYGVAYMDDFLPSVSINALRNEIASLIQNNNMNSASIGTNNMINKAIRGDSIKWLHDDINSSEALKSYFKNIEDIRLDFNEKYFLGLVEYESHFANYDKGTAYKKHIDVFKISNNMQFTLSSKRFISCILYLNDDTWCDIDGGYLRIYDNNSEDALSGGSEVFQLTKLSTASLPDASSTDILPKGGRIVIFLSKKFYHEVLPSLTKARVSLTGWFKTR